jgi:hypothetical protein
MIINAKDKTDVVLEYKTESMRLLEKHEEIIESKHYSEIKKSLKAPTAFLIENTEDWLNEDANLHGDLQYYKEMIVPIFRESVSKTKLLEVVGFQPINQSPSAFYVERFYYGGTSANGTGRLLKTQDRGNGNDPEFMSNVVRITCTTGEYSAIVAGTSFIRASGGAATNLAKVIFKEETGGGAKLLVKIETGQTLPAVGNVYVTGPNVDVAMTNVWNNELGRSVILSTYGGPMTTDEGELLNDQPTIKLSLEAVNVNASSHKLAFELSQETITDLARRTGDDAKKRLVGAINWQLAMSVNRKLFNLMSSQAEIGSAWSYAGADGRMESEKLLGLRRKFKWEQNRIGVKTQKGRANFGIVPPAVGTVIEMQPGFTKVIAQEGGDQAGIIKLGILDGITYYQTTMDGEAGDFAVLGYKGAEEHESGVFYCPMVPLMVSRANDFNNPERQKVSFSQRAAYEKNPYGADRYLTYFDIDLTGSSIK